MKKLKIISIISSWHILISFVQLLFAQGYGGPLTFHGMDHFIMHSAVQRAMGGVTLGGGQYDIGLMFQNPAALYSITGIQISLGGLKSFENLHQEQNYAPVRYYPNLSLLLEGLTGYIPDPDTSLVGFSAQDTVQRPFDDIGPNWSKSSNQTIPIHALAAVPISLGNMKIIGGIGTVAYANLSHYYQNNNVLSPPILSQRPIPTLRPTDDNPIEVDWLQSIRSREGTIQGYGVAMAVSMEKYNLAVGISGMILDGSCDDYEQEVGRGNLTFFSNAFRLDSVYRKIVRTGVSDFSGQEFTFSSIITGRYVNFGFSLKPPVSITRSYTMKVSRDTSGTPVFSTMEGKDKLKIPWRGTIGLSLTPKENLRVGLEYEFRRYKFARYIDSNGKETSPWLPASLFRIGFNYLVAPWFTLQGGMRGEAEVFEPEGNQIIGEPVTYTVYSTGIGLLFSGLQLNIAYEYSLMKYQDIWASAISKNNEKQHTIFTQLSYQLPWLP